MGGGGGVAIKVTRMLKILNTTTETYQSVFFFVISSSFIEQTEHVITSYKLSYCAEEKLLECRYQIIFLSSHAYMYTKLGGSGG